jgi:citrate synthase
MSYVPGLVGVVVGETSISNVEGEIGRLSYRGRVIEDVVHLPYTEAMCLVLFGEVPGEDGLELLEEYLYRFGRLSEAEVNLIASMPATVHPMQALQSVLSVVSLEDVRFRDRNMDTSHGLQILAKYPSIIAALHASRGGGANTGRFSESSDYLERFLMMFTDKKPTIDELEAYRIVQLLQLDHSFNAGTFASRVISSTLASVPAVLAGAAGALSGVLHGGADQAALLSAREVGRPGLAQHYVDELLASKGRLMGMGHREYRTVDPRARILKPLARDLCVGSALENDFLILEALETAFNKRMNERGKEVWANVEFYKGVVYEALGIPSDFFTANFAMSRSVGWLAHFMESRANNKIIRPAALYVGPAVDTKVA